MRRVVITGLFKYPHGNATSNYVQNLADALLIAGYTVEIASRIDEDFSENYEFEYRNVKIHEIYDKRSPKFVRRLVNGRLFYPFYLRKLKAFHLSQDDVVITFSGEKIGKPVRDLQRKQGFKVIHCPLEWFGSDQYSSRREYRKAAHDYEKIRYSDAILPISHHIANHFSEIPQLILPPMTNTAGVVTTAKNTDRYNVILPANGMMKDSFEDMIKGFCMLSDEELQKVTFHIKGVGKERIVEIIGEKMWQRILGSVQLHDWMVYDELVSLYNSMHYLMLARETNQMTLSNFPSKVPEVMTYGVVPVVSKVGDYTQYYLTDGIDSLIFAGSKQENCTEAFRRAINTSYSDYEILSANARKCASERFDFRKWSPQISELIESLFNTEKK